MTVVAAYRNRDGLKTVPYRSLYGYRCRLIDIGRSDQPPPRLRRSAVA